MLLKPVNPFGTATINITCIAQDPTNSNTLYLGTGEKNGSRQVGSGIYKSTDGGVSWSSLASTTFSGPSSNFSYVSKILVASNGDVYARFQNIEIDTPKKMQAFIKGKLKDLGFPSL